MEITFKVEGKPFGKQRPRFGGGRTYTPKETILYENKVALFYKQEAKGKIFPPDTPIKMSIKAVYEVPKSKPKYKKALMYANKLRPMTKPDIDNIFKVCADALNKIAYPDDQQLYLGIVEKFYVSSENELPYVQITLESE